MLGTRKFYSLSLTALLGLALASTASAGTFLQFVGGGGTPFTVTNVGGASQSVSVTNAPVSFEFTLPTLLGAANVARSGTLNYSATSALLPVGPVGGNDTQNGYTGSGSIVDIATGTTALSWTFGPSGSILLNMGGTGGNATDGIPPAAEIAFLSPYLNFSVVTTASYSFALSGATSGWAIGAGGYFANDTSSLTGTFDATPFPTSSSPEPATMALLGSALVGLGIFGRKRFTR